MEQCFEQLREVLGICVERRVDLGNAVLAVLGMLGLVSLLLAYRQLREGQRAQREQASATRARFVLDLNQEFLSNEGEREFSTGWIPLSGQQQWAIVREIGTRSFQTMHLLAVSDWVSI